MSNANEARLKRLKARAEGMGLDWKRFTNAAIELFIAGNPQVIGSPEAWFPLANTLLDVLSMNFNELRGLWLHFDEEREVNCKVCAGSGKPIWMHFHSNYGKACSACHGAKRKRVRVRGAVQVELDRGELVVFGDNFCLRASTKRGLMDAVITAYLAGDLPGDVTEFITREDV